MFLTLREIEMRCFKTFRILWVVMWLTFFFAQLTRQQLAVISGTAAKGNVACIRYYKMLIKNTNKTNFFSHNVSVSLI